MIPPTRPIPLNETHLDELKKYLGPKAHRSKYRISAEKLLLLPPPLDSLLEKTLAAKNQCTGTEAVGCTATRPGGHSQAAEWFRVVRRSNGSWALKEIFEQEAPQWEPEMRLILPAQALTPAWMRRVMFERGLNIRVAEPSLEAAI